MNTFSAQKNKGFTLIEMLIAVFIFTMSLAALMTISARGLRVAHDAQKQVVADYLALEGIEGVRNIRDSELVDLDRINTWEALFDEHNCWSEQDQGNVSSCSLVFSGSALELFPCSGLSCRVFYSEPRYSYRQFNNTAPEASYRPSGFSREIQFTQVPANPDEVIVTVIVSWDGGSVEYVEELFLWI